jgi:hypothetical protein
MSNVPQSHEFSVFVLHVLCLARQPLVDVWQGAE